MERAHRLIELGTCGNGATVSIGISNGQCLGRRMVSASGRVADAGSISVTLASGIKRATGFGHLCGHVGIRHLARPAVLGHLDRDADLIGLQPTFALNIPRR